MDVRKPAGLNLTRQDYWALGLILLGTLLRLFIVLSGELNLYTDEAQYWDWSRSLDFSYYSKGPLIAYWIWFWTRFFGPTELGVRFGALFNVCIFQLLLFWGLRKICILKGYKNSLIPLWTLIIVNSSPLFLVSGILMTTDNLLVLCYLICLFSLYFYFSTEEKKYLFLMGIFFALGILAKYTMLIFLPLTLFLTFKEKKKLFKEIILVLLLFSCIGLLPILKWNLDHNWVGLKHVLYRGSLAGNKAKDFFRLSKVPEFLGSQLGVLTPWWFIFFFWGGLKLGQKKYAFLTAWEKNFLLVFTYPIFLLFFLLSFHTKIEPNWPALSYIAGIVFIALVFKSISKRSKVILLVLSGFIFVIFHSLPFLHLPPKLDLLQRMRGYQELGDKLKVWQQERFSEPEKVFLLSDTYGVTAELSFYGPAQKRAYCVNLGRKLNQYDIFGPPEDKKGWDAIFVSKDKEKRIPEKLLRMFSRVEGPFWLETRNKDKRGITFTLFFAYNYNGYWPKPEKHTF